MAGLTNQQHDRNVSINSLGVEPVDKDVMRRPPRQAKDGMITLSLLVQVFCTAMIIVAGTLYVFWREVRGHVYN